MEPKRKQMRLREYDYHTPGAYFVTLCTKDKACILSTIVGADAHIGPYPRLTRTGKVVEKYLRNIPGVGKYVIMPNHIHMILRISAEDILYRPMWASAPTSANIPQLIKSFKIMVTRNWEKVFGNDPTTITLFAMSRIIKHMCNILTKIRRSGILMITMCHKEQVKERAKHGS